MKDFTKSLGGPSRELEVFQMSAAVFTRKRFETDESFTTAQELGLDFTREPFGLEEFRLGMDIELVHGSSDLVTDVTHNDPVLTGKLVLAHLRKRADYYTRLVECSETCPVSLHGAFVGDWTFAMALHDEEVERSVPLTQAEIDCHEQFEFSVDEAEITGATIGIDFSQEDFEAEDLARAMNVELEHGCCHPETNVTHCDPILTAKLAVAHLRERADFYRHLEDVEGHLPR